MRLSNIQFLDRIKTSKILDRIEQMSQRICGSLEDSRHDDPTKSFEVIRFIESFNLNGPILIQHRMLFLSNTNRTVELPGWQCQLNIRIETFEVAVGGKVSTGH